MKIKAVSYLRVSGIGQVKGTGLDRQKETIARHAKQRGFTIIREYREAHTGTDADRPVFAEMVEDLLSNGAKTVIIESLDRLARDLIVSNQLIALLIRKGVSLISATTGQDITDSMSQDPMLKAIIQIQGVFAELEKNLLVRKLRKSRDQVRKEKGRCEGRKPFGFYPEEKAVINRMKQIYRKPRNEPRRSFYQITKILNEEGHKTRTKKPWNVVTVKRILER